MKGYLLESFEEFCEGQDFIIEAAESSELKDLKDSYARTKKAFAALKAATTDLRQDLYYFESNAPSPESKAAADHAYNSIKGSFQYVLNGDLDKYWDKISDNIEKSIKSANIKPKGYKVRVPKEADFSRKELENLLRAIDIDKPSADHQLYYERGYMHTMLKSRNGGSFSGTATQDSDARYTLRDILDFFNEGNPKVVNKWVKFMQQNTGLLFRTSGEKLLYVEW